jgi:hypothetical protein
MLTFWLPADRTLHIARLEPVQQRVAADAHGRGGEPRRRVQVGGDRCCRRGSPVVDQRVFLLNTVPEHLPPGGAPPLGMECLREFWMTL